MLMKQLFLKQFVFEPFIFRCMQEGAHRESTAVMSWTPIWSKEEELAILGAVNSEVHRKPKYGSEYAA